MAWFDPLLLLESYGMMSPESGRVLWSLRSRHDTALVDIGSGRYWFIKRPGPPTVMGSLTLDGERRFYTELEAGRLPPGLISVVPRLVEIVGDGKVLVVEGFPEHITQRAALLDGGIDTETIPPRLGQALGMLHSMRDPMVLSGFPLIEHPVATHGRCTPEMLAQGPRAYPELLRLLQEDPCLNDRLRELRASWEPTSVIHGDMKLDNVLVSREGDVAYSPLIVDWELAGRGDSRWDCGSLIGSYLFTWMESLRPGLDASISRNAYEKVLKAIRSFWTSYVAEREHDPSFDAQRDQNDVFAWAGYWLLQRVLIMLPIRLKLTALDFTVLDVASRLITPPSASSYSDPTYEYRRGDA